MSPARRAPLARVEALMGKRLGVGRERARAPKRRTTQGRTRKQAVATVGSSLPPEAIAARVQAHVAWREQAQQLVEALGRAAQPLTGDARTQHVAAVAKLSQAIVRSYLDSAVLQGRQGQWEDALSSAQQAVERVQALATLGGVSPQAMEPLTVKSYLQRGYARFMRDGNSPQLREELVEAQARFPRSPSLAKWTAHYQVMAGHLAEARRTLQPVLDFTKIQPQFTALRALTHPLDTRATEQAYPCNFYAYRYELVGDTILEAMRVQVNLIRTWDPANNSAPLEKLQKLIDEAAEAAGQQAREAALASVAAQDQDTVADDLEKEAASDSRMFTERQLHQNINHLPKRNLTANPAAAAEQRKRNADEAARKAAEAAKTQTIDALQALKKQVPLAGRVLEALTAWNAGIRAFRHQNYVGATLYFRDTRVAILQYFSVRYPANKYPVPNTEAGVYTTLCRVARDILANQVARPAGAANKLPDHWRKRLASNTLEGSSRENLTRIDWFLPTLPFTLKVGKTENPFADAVDLLTLLGDAIGKAPECQKVEEKVDAPLLTLALVHVSLGIAEARRFHRDFDGALSECRQLEARHEDFKLLSQTIEVPFVALMKAHTLLEKGDAEYKSRMLAPDSNTTLWKQYQGLIAADTYRGVFDTLRPLWSGYVTRVEDGITAYNKKLERLLTLRFHPLAPPGSGTPMKIEDRQEFRTLNTFIPIKSVIRRSVRKGVAGTPQQVNPHLHPLEPVLDYALENGQKVQDTNPLIYALLTQAHARLIQIQAGLNYIGYRDDYVPPWRFSFLLERARYFAEHTKGAQRDYLNFLANAEREEERETSARQAVVLAKGNLRIAEARSEKEIAGVAIAISNVEVSNHVQIDAAIRAKEYSTFNAYLEKIAQDVRNGWPQRGFAAALPSATGGLSTAYNTYTRIGKLKGSDPKGSGWAAAVGAVVHTGLSIWSSFNIETLINQQLDSASMERALELATLQRAATEAAESANVATTQLRAAKAGLLVSALEWAADLMHHEFSQQNYTYLLRRQLGSEQWYRLAHGMRSVGERYLRYAVEMAFLAEQAYEFEASKSMNVIRFDYDTSEIGHALAGDFLLADLDTLEQDLVVTRQQKEQQVRFVVSLARDYPDALDQLRREGSTLVAVTLDRLERRFPGLLNIRVGAVELLPVALMDPTRFSVQLTYAGAGQVRTDAPVDLGGQTDTLPYRKSWIPDADARWPVKMHIGQIETTVFSGLSRTDRQAVFPFMLNSQRGAFERLPAAAIWHITMSLKENQVLPGSLADLLLTFSLSGTHDAALQEEVEKAVPAREVLTRWFSTAQSFADAFYSFNQTGKMELPITRDRLALTGKVENLRNFGLVLVPSQDEPLFNAVTAGVALECDVSSTGTVTVLTPTPEITFSITQLKLSATVVLSDDASAEWDFGDGSGWVKGSPTDHTYQRPGKYTVTLRWFLNGRLLEYAAAVVVSRVHAVKPPLTVAIDTPTATVGGTVPAGKVRLEASAVLPAGEGNLSLTWRLGTQPSNTTGTFTVAPGRYVLVLTAARVLTARLYAGQRWLPDVPITLAGLSVATNRLFDDTTGSPTNETTYNQLAKHLFGPGPLAPPDKWVLDLPLTDNPHLRVVDQQDSEKINETVLEDVLIAVEYEQSW